MPTLVLSPRYSPDSVALREAARAAGWRVERLRSWAVPPELAGQELVVYAEPLFVACVAEALGMALLEPPLDWLPRLPESYRLREVRAGVLGEVRERARARFLKPADDKCFPARVYDPGEAIPGADVLPDETPVLVAEPVAFAVEYRAFVAGGQVRTLSPYARHGDLAQGEDGSWPAPAEERAEAAAFLAALLAEPAVEVPLGVVVDVGVIEGRGWAVVEANPAWGSGRYGCDPAAVLGVIAASARPAGGLAPEEARWVVARS